MSVTVSGFDQLKTQVEDAVIIGGRLGLRAAGNMITDVIKGHFEEQEGPDSQVWPDVPVGWLQQRVTYPRGGSESEQRAYIEDAKALIDTGTLRDSIAYVDGGEDQDGNVTGAVDTPVPYAIDHNEGVPGEIRQREFMWIDEDTYKSATEMVGKAVQESLT